MNVHQIYTNSPLRNFNYVIEGSQGHCLVIDPYDGEEILAFAHERGLLIRGIINTHEHYDHTCGNAVIVKKTACPVYAHPNAKSKVAEANTFLGEGERINIDDHCYLQVIDTPGHTFAHLCFLLFEHGECVGVFTGDTLFNAGIGNCRNGGNVEVYYETMENKFKQLADSVMVYPGHEYLVNNLSFTLSVEPNNERAQEMLVFAKGLDWMKETYQNTMGQERQVNAFLRLDSKEIAQSLGTDNQKDIFINLRKLRDQW